MGIALICIIGIFVFFYFQNRNNPDVKNASELQMDIRRYKKYEEIYNEQLKCHEEKRPVPNRMDEIKNMNEWRRYCDWRYNKERASMFDELDKLRNQK